ncbi:MAG: hypothetical protein M0P69_03725 [Bacteroidales bacterium]|nr:hypothetical protein [Bacteroidales bacterium]
MRAVSSGHRSEHTPSIVLSDRSMKVRRSEVTRPVSGDVVVIEGTSYIVTDEPSGTPWEWTVDLAEAAA